MRLVVFVAELFQEMVEQQRNIFPAIAQRRKLKVNHVQAVIQILAKAAFAHQREQIHVGRGDDAHVHLDGVRAAQAHEFALLNHAQQLGLRLRADGGNFVEENRALIGDFEQALFRSDRAGERALHVAEQLRLQQIDGNRAGIDRHEGLVRARRRGMNRLGD